MKGYWKQFLAGLLAAVMLLGLLPTAALAALTDNTPDQNAAILQELKDFWGDDKTAEEALALLREYGLVDEDGNVLKAWSGELTLEEEAAPLSFEAALALDTGTVTVNGRACGASELRGALETMEALGLLSGGAPAADWELTLDGEPAAPEALLAALAAPAAEAPEDGTPETETAETGAVTVLGADADREALLSLLAFLDAYGLLTDTGAAADWGMTLPGGNRKTDLSELLKLLEDGNTDRNRVVTVDGTAITLGDFETMVKIEAEVKRIREEYSLDKDRVELTKEQGESLASLYEQLSQNGITLYNTQGADDLVFPSGADQTQRVTVPASVRVANGGSADLTVSLAHAAQNDMSVRWRIAEGSASGTIGGETAGTLAFRAGDTSKALTVSSSGSEERWNGNRAFVVEFFDLTGALFDNEDMAASTRVLVSKEYAYPTQTDVDFSYASGTQLYAIAPKDQGGILVVAKPNEYFPKKDGGEMSGCYSRPGDISISFNNSSFNFNKAIRSETYDVYIYYPENIRQMVEDGILNEVTLKNTNTYPTGSPQAWGDSCTVEARAQINETVIGTHTFHNPKGGINDSLTIYPGLTHSSAPLIRGLPYLKYTVDLSRTERFHSADGDDSSYWFLISLKTYQDGKPPAVESVTAQDGPYAYGQVIPITVKFSEPVCGSGLTLTANGRECAAVDQEDGHFGYRQTFLYTVPKSGDTQLQVTGVTGGIDLSKKAMTAYDPGRDTQVLPSGAIQIPALLSAVNAPSAQVTDLAYTPAAGDQPEKTTATVTVTMAMPADPNLRQLITGTYGDGRSSVLAASLDGGRTLIPIAVDAERSTLTATVAIDAQTVMAQQDFVMELYTIDGSTHESTGLLFGRYAAFSINKPTPLSASDLSITTPDGWPGDAPVYVNDPPEKAALTLRGNVTPPEGCTWTQTRWVSGDPSIATIDAGGVVFPLKAGTVNFYLEAVNGGLAEYAGERSDPVTLTLQEGAEPYLRIPESELRVRSGDPVTLRWASNLVQKNAEFGENAATAFTIAVKDAEGADIAGSPFTVTYDPSDKDDAGLWIDGSPNQSFTLMGLEKVSQGNNPSYTVTLSAGANAGVPGSAGKTFTATAEVFVVSRPVSVKLGRPESFYKVNDGTLTIPYTLENYDAGNDAAFQLTVTDNATGEKITELDTPAGETGGSFSIDLSEAQTNGFRTIYDVSLEAKNTTEKDFSRDSFTLYIYDKDCLDILVQPVSRDGVDTVAVNGDSVKMSNRAWIESLSQNQILSLNRDINLQAAISINYGDHAWGEASDRIKWASENSGVAAVNYPQGAYYENVEGLPYSAYAPATEFLLSGKSDGTTAVEAVHALAGDALGASAEITVETLKDKLYLFQFYPAAKATLTYTNGAGRTVEHDTDDQGRAAVYEDTGIASDVYVKAVVDGDTYLGTVYRSKLVSQEKDAVSLELYPLNALTLRKVATLPVYLKNPDGTGYTGGVQVRAGVYRNGEYCENAFADPETNAGQLGKSADYTVKFQNGKYVFQYDLTQFSTASQPDAGTANPVTAADKIQFVLELRAAGGGTNYYPVLFTANGSTNEDDAVRLGERVVNLEAAAKGQENQPFVARQVVYYAGSENGPATDVRGKAGNVGPSADYPDVLLSTTVLWWGADGMDAPDSQRAVRYADGMGIFLSGQKTDSDQYPFCSMPVSHNTVSLNRAQMDTLGLKDLTPRPLALQYIGADGTTVKQQTMRWQLLNAVNMPKAGDSKNLLASIDQLQRLISTSDGGLDVSNGFLAVGLSLATKAGIDTNFLKLQLAPTEDPTVFRGLVYVGLGDGDEADGNLLSVMNPEDEGSYELNYMPGLDDVKDMFSSGLSQYGKTQKDLLTSAKNILTSNIKQGGRSSTVSKDGGPSYTLSGYFETEVYYDFDAEAWKMAVVTGGFSAGGGFGYDWSFNFQAGPVPLFLDLGVGISGMVTFNAAIDNTTKMNDYLTQLRLNAYLGAFGGFGFDYAVVALKLGIFGTLSMDATLRWLNKATGGGADFGYKLAFSGEVGVKAQVTVLFFSYSAVLWSEDFSAGKQGKDWSGIEDYWKEVGAGKTGSGALIHPQANLLMADPDTGMAVYSAEQETTLLDRDYLDQYQRAYSSAGPGRSAGLFSTFSNGPANAPSNIVETLKNSYSLATPALSDDGAYLFYLDDGADAKDATNVRVAVMERNRSNGYDKGAVIDDDGYGDSGLNASGSGGSVVAVWSRVMEKPAVTEPGQAVTPDIQVAMMNSSDIMAAVRSGGRWTVQNLSASADGESNGLSDLSPVVAANGKHILVAWRQVSSSNAVDLTDFDARDYIMYRVSEDGGANWSDVQPIYNGTSGAVKGIEAAMLPDGTAAVAFALQSGEAGTESGKSRQEIAYAVVSKAESGEGYGVTRYVQLTDDGNLNENPQIAAVMLGEKAVFVLGWHSLSAEGGDIRLAAVDAKGNRVTDFADSLSSLIQNTGVAVSSNFQFVQNASTLDDLSILWSERAAGAGAAGEQGADAAPPTHDYLSGLRFRTDGNKVSVTSAQRLLEMPDYTAIDSFNAYVDGESVYAVLQGTFYDYGKPEKVEIPDHAPVYIASDRTSIFTAAGDYTDTLRVDSVIPDYPNIKKGMQIPVQVSVTNLGTVPMNRVAVTIGDQTTEFEVKKESAFVAIAPGETRTLTDFYTIPATGAIEDPDYTVTGTFAGDGNTRDANEDTQSGSLILNIPDLGIAGSDILVKAEDGFRTLQFNLLNLSDAALAGSGRTVRFNLYSDAACTKPIPAQYLTELQSLANGEEQALKEITGDDLAAIDEGSYTLQYKFDLGKYIQQQDGGLTPFADENGEVRDGGVTLYAKAWVQLADGEMVEFNAGNNVVSVNLESLLKQAGGNPVTIESTPSEAGGTTTVTVRLQNNSIVESQGGNISVTLLDENNQILGWQQSYDVDHSLLKLVAEQSYSRDFTFQGVTGVWKALVTYDKKVTLNDDATLNSLVVQGVPVSLDDFTSDGSGNYAATVVAEDIASTVVNAQPRSTASTVSIAASTPEVPMLLANGATEPSSTKTVTMSPGGVTTITVTVTAQDESTKTYTLTIMNKNSTPGISEQTAEASATYGADTVTLTVSANVPGNENATLTYQWYRYDGEGTPTGAAGESWTAIEGATEKTYVIDKGAISAGTHYYYCKVTSTNVSGNSFVVDSSVVPVNVAQAETPAIIWPKVTTQLTFGDALSKAEDDLKSGRLAFPNEFTPDYEIGTFDWVQPDAIPTVDTTQANAVYTPSADIQKNYKSFALEKGGVPTMLDITVNKAAAPTVTWPTAAAIDYGQTLKKAVLSGGALDFDGTFDYTKNKSFSANPIGTFAWHEPDTVPAVENSGFQVDYSAGGFVKANYGTISNTAHTTALTVNRATPTVNVTTDVSTQKIGNPVTATITVTNPNNPALTDGFPTVAQVNVTGTLGENRPQMLSITAVDGKHGVYQATFDIANDTANKGKTLTFSVTLAQSANYLAASTPRTATVGVTDKAVHVQTLTGPASVIYGDPASFTTRLEKAHYGEGASRQPSGTVAYTLNGKGLFGKDQSLTVTENDGVATLTLERSDLPAGQYTLTANYGGDKNYQASAQSFNFTVTPRPVTATADNITAYAGAIPALTVSYDGLPKGVTSLSGVQAKTEATEASPAGDYPITLTVEAGGDSKNYAVTAVPGALTLKPRSDEAPIALPEEPDAEKHIPAVALDQTEQEALKDQLTGKSLENLKLMVTSVAETGEDAKALLAKLAGYRLPENGEGFYDVSLVDTANGNRVLDFDGSATLTFPYPENTDASGYRFVILHLKDGAVSAYTPEATADGLKITVKNGFSPFLVVYAVRSSGGSGGAGGSGASNITVTMSGSKGGTVSPALSSLKSGATQTFTFTPNEGYRVADVKVNRKSVGAVETYTAKQVKEDLVIEVTFEPIEAQLEFPFTDVPDTAWYRDAVEYVYGRGLFAGTSDTTFSPNSPMTRAMLVTVLYRAAGEPSIEDEIWGYPFADVDAESWYGAAVYWARLKGIVNGYSDELFGPNDTITREQLAVMLYRYADSPAAPNLVLDFTDAVTVSDFAQDAMRWSVGMEIITGKGGGILDPKGEATRAQVAAMLQRFIKMNTK